ncbi:Putative pilin/flagellin [Halorhabdus sp. SVX81]|uniref:DUF7287 family protein n=1 Tax=Halorhabdus sp. SVX81 TaxID=2978283 RepID=UPI0023DC1245|nr:hypothetical protein [Halorhabdus sp. SVX81]WEL17879.1 Putative pilin/flagellin [Halorhabdus sp. SVX81]
MDTRGQTLQDFVLGISIFMLGFVLVLSLIPGLLTPFESSVGANEQAAADRVTSTIVSNLSMPAQPNTLNGTNAMALFSLSTTDLKDRFGVGSSMHLNVTVEYLDGSAPVAMVGDPVTRDEFGKSSRIVSVDVPGSTEPAYRLIVKVW